MMTMTMQTKIPKHIESMGTEDVNAFTATQTQRHDAMMSIYNQTKKQISQRRFMHTRTLRINYI